MVDLVVAKRAPFGVDVEKGNSYWWCACCMSREQLFCDDSQKDKGIGPSNYSTDNSSTVYF